MGRDGFEPSNSEEDRFTVCCRWPLGYLPDYPKSQRRDSNPRPADYKSAALPTELLWPIIFKLSSEKSSPKYTSADQGFTAYHTYPLIFFGKAKVSEFVKFKNFDSLFFLYFEDFMKIDQCGAILYKKEAARKFFLPERLLFASCPENDAPFPGKNSPFGEF